MFPTPCITVKVQTQTDSESPCHPPFFHSKMARYYYKVAFAKNLKYNLRWSKRKSNLHPTLLSNPPSSVLATTDQTAPAQNRGGSEIPVSSTSSNNLKPYISVSHSQGCHTPLYQLRFSTCVAASLRLLSTIPQALCLLLAVKP